MRPRAFHAVLAALCAAAVLAGCASSGSVKGARDRTRTVRIGAEAIIRLPASTTRREWRLVTFDSRKLPPTTAHLRLEGTLPDAEWVMRFTARSPGTADVVFERIVAGPSAPGPVGERKRFTFRVRS